MPKKRMTSDQKVSKSHDRALSENESMSSQALNQLDNFFNLHSQSLKIQTAGRISEVNPLPQIEEDKESSDISNMYMNYVDKLGLKDKKKNDII
jgi:hypothetical protein